MKHEKWCCLYRPSKKVVCNAFSVLAVTCMYLVSISAQADAKHWVGTWACAPYKAANNKPSNSFDNTTLRQIVRVSIGGDTLRVKFSNITCATPVSIKSVNIAESKGGSVIDAATMKKLTFNGDSSITMNAKSSATSDPVAFNLKPGMRLAITIFYNQCKSSDDMTFHYGSRTDSYYLTGEKTSSADFAGASKIERWFTLSNIDVLAPDTAAAVAVLGNSITDGYGLSGGLQNRWTDAFSEKLLANPKTRSVGVLNLGIGATNVASGDNCGINRYQQDILGQQGLRWFVIFYGVNDINGGATATMITNAYKTMIAEAHKKNLKVFCATITPFKNHSYYTPDHEKHRLDVNKWIRTDASLDGFIDFDKAIRNPSDTAAMRDSVKNDWLHPNAKGYKLLGESVDLKLFEPDSVDAINLTKNKRAAYNRCSISSCNGSNITFELTEESFVSMKLYTMLGKEIGEIAGKTYSSGSHSIDIKNSSVSKGMYFCTLRSGKFLSSRVVLY